MMIKVFKVFPVFLFLLLLTAPQLMAQPEFSAVNAAPGAFSRMGYGPRGMAMGNAFSAVSQGLITSSYYNPAQVVYQQDNNVGIGYTILSFDRSLNFLSFTKKIDFFSRDPRYDKGDKPAATAGVSFGLINAGISGIDGRDRQGMKTEELATSENQFFFSFANRFSEKFSAGISLKFYYYKLYEDITTTGFGMDLGVSYRPIPEWTIAVVFKDLNSKYEWDTSDLYGQQGSATIDRFPLEKRIGMSYILEDYNLLLAGEFSADSYGANLLRFGGEVTIFDVFQLRAGLDNFVLSNGDDPMRPSFGFAYFEKRDGISVGVDYAFVHEPYSASDRHVIGVNLLF